MTMTARPARNGVDVPTLFATLDAVRDTPEIAQFQFRATNRWIGGTHSRSTFHDFHGAMQEMTHPEPRTFDADHPAVLVGADHGPTPVEYLLHALAACITAGVANIAACRGVDIDEVSTTVEGDIDLMGLLGLDPSVRNGFQNVSVKLAIRGADPDALRRVVEQSCARSAVLDVMTNGVPVSIEVDAA